MSAPLSIFSYWTYVAPASILAGPTQEQLQQPERELTLREEASSDGLTWLKVVRQLDCGDLYLAHVAASPDMETPFLVFLTEEQLRFALPWDARLANRCLMDGILDSERILPALYAHHAAIQPAVRRCLPSTDQANISVPQSATSRPDQGEETLTPLPPVFVTERHMKKVLGPNPEEALGGKCSPSC